MIIVSALLLGGKLPVVGTRCVMQETNLLLIVVLFSLSLQASRLLGRPEIVLEAAIQTGEKSVAEQVQTGWSCLVVASWSNVLADQILEIRHYQLYGHRGRAGISPSPYAQAVG